MASIAGLWRFQPGDDPRYADPAFDDSHWKLLRSTEPWTSQGYKGLSGYAWYRFRVMLPPGSEPMSLLLPEIVNAYQCYADGRLLRTVGVLPKAGEALPWGTVTPSPAVLALRIGPRASVETVTIALRVWHTARPGIEGGGVYLGDLGSLTGIRVGSSDALGSRLSDMLAVARYNNSGELDIAALDMLAAIIVLSLYLLHRTGREYLWFSISYALAAAGAVLDYASLGRFWSGAWTGCFLALFDVGSWLAYLLFYKDLLGARAGWAFRLACAGIAGGALLGFFSSTLGLLPGSWEAGLVTVSYQPTVFWILFLLLRRSREGMLEARLLLVP